MIIWRLVSHGQRCRDVVGSWVEGILGKVSGVSDLPS